MLRPGTPAMDEPPPPGFVRVSLACRQCGEVAVFDLQRGVGTLARLRLVWGSCTACGSSRIEIATDATADSEIVAAPTKAR